MYLILNRFRLRHKQFSCTSIRICFCFDQVVVDNPQCQAGDKITQTPYQGAPGLIVQSQMYSIILNLPPFKAQLYAE